MADESIFDPITDLHPRMMKVLAKRVSLGEPSLRVHNWPNPLGEVPSDALGKTVKISDGDGDELFIIDSVSDDRLNLKQVGAHDPA